MTIEKTKLHIVDIKKGKQEHKTETMALLKKLLDEKGSSQLELANTLGRDKTTVNRWVKNSREISWDNAEKIASVLGCHPVDIYAPKNQIKLRYYAKWDGDVLEFEKQEQSIISIPYEYYHENVKAVQIQAPGFHADGEIWLFDMPIAKKFSKFAIGKLCYLTASKSFKKKHENKSKKCKPVIALLKAESNGKLSIVNSYTDKPLNDLCSNLDIEDLEYATPVKAKYDPDLYTFKINH